MKSKYMTREVVICATVKYYLQVFVDWNCVNKKFLIPFLIRYLINTVFLIIGDGAYS